MAGPLGDPVILVPPVTGASLISGPLVADGVGGLQLIDGVGEGPFIAVGVRDQHWATMQHYMMLRRNLLYTGISRGEKLVILVGDKNAIAKAVEGKTDERRWSKLRERLSA